MYITKKILKNSVCSMPCHCCWLSIFFFSMMGKIFSGDNDDFDRREHPACWKSAVFLENKFMQKGPCAYV